ncbi:MAG: SCO family protein [Gammaproteobacteria bacterium]|nr:SCO family protein [Gammaproteobacteria bacterium]
MEKRKIPVGTIILGLMWAVLLVIAFIIMTPRQRDASPELQGVLWPEPKQLLSFELMDQERRPFTTESLKGKWTMLFFGYTYCPDICPMAMSVLKMITTRLEQFPEIAADTQVVFVSVDPERDPPEKLAEYTAYFNRDFIGVTGSVKEIDALAKQIGAGYIKEPPAPSGDYLIAHSSTIFLIDPQVRLYAVFSQPHDPETIVGQYEKIRSLGN